ncbi:MAG: adenosine-specific kinase [Thermoplasmata archaeon]|jgi:adenosine/AMP kinase|nr:adenosine monophosphate-protein transferase [Thermoplasmatales archaeon]PMP73703.1 MAG: adenosine monophosphate-protein transferase [Aciduliprofundum sp.]HEU13149.1 adenosine monophosphate-protein transferase [Euryarchaeota archaeon]
MNIKSVEIEKPEEDINVILGQSHFIKSVEDLYEALVTSVPNGKFGLAFCEASGKRLIRYEGNDELLIRYAIKNAENVGAGHFFIILLKNFYPINVLNAIKDLQEVLTIFAASANPLRVVIYEEDDMRAVLGVMDGFKPLGVENDQDKKERKEFLRRIGYKL